MGMYSEMMTDLRRVFGTRRTRDLSFRKQQLEAIIRMLDDCKEDIITALNKDLGRCRYEADVCDVLLSRNECVSFIKNLSDWMKPEKVDGGIENITNQVMKMAEPLGVVLIIGTWNYPVNLVLGPLIGAIAAGNCVVIKTSEVAEHTSELLARIIPRYLDPECFRVVTGAVPEVTALLEEHFDKIFYTGNSFVGKIIMTAAAKHLTPVTLELGGKSPVYIDTDNDFSVVANRIIAGKLVNNGQTCIAPDYLLVQHEVKDKLISSLKKSYETMYSGDSLNSESCARVINTNHFNRLKGMMKEGNVIIGGRVDEDKHNIELSVFTDVPEDATLWQNEIFGPLLLLKTVDSASQAVEFINSRPKPLALYVFSRDSTVQHKLLSEVSSGGAVVNDTLMHFATPNLPFGGVGNSGMGNYHGKASFETFSHRKSVLVTKQNMEMVFNAVRYPPYSDVKLDRINRFMKKNVRSGLGLLPIALVVGALAVIAVRFLGLGKYLGIAG